jgi:multidrug transporter EmrE-like cation transporter
MPWVLLSVAILLEVVGITSMKLSRGFAELIPSIAVPVFYVFSAAALIPGVEAARSVGDLRHLVGGWARRSPR